MSPYPQPGATGVPAEKSTDARKILHDMATQLASAPGFRVTIRSDYDAIQPDGQRIAFGEQRLVQLQRPDRLRVDTLRSDGEQGMLLLDGKSLTLYRPQDNAYARIERQGSVDEMVVHLVRDMQVKLPLARLLLTRLPAELDQLLTSVAYVEENLLFDVPTDHIAAQSADVDVQLWITQGEQRLPRRIVITYKQEPGQPQFRADLTDWDLTPCTRDSLFAWTPPAGTERLDLLTPLRQHTAPATGQGVSP